MNPNKIDRFHPINRIIRAEEAAARAKAEQAAEPVSEPSPLTEASLLKNPRSRRSKMLRCWIKRPPNCIERLAMTGECLEEEARIAQMQKVIEEFDEIFGKKGESSSGE